MNKKISELTTAVSLMRDDYLALVQNNATKKISIDKLFSSGIPVPLNVKNKLVYGATPETISNGPVSLELPISHVLLTGQAEVIVLPLGVEGQTKIIVAITGNGNTTVSANMYQSTIRFVKAGDSVNLLFTGGKWTVLGGTAQVS